MKTLIICIYLITNKVNGKRYVGQTSKTIEERFKKHIYDSFNGKRQQALHHAIRKYGSENFEIKIVARCNSFEESNHREALCVKLYRTMSPNGYNLMEGGSNSKKSEESKKKMSEAQSGEKHWAFGKRGLECHLTGRKLPESTKRKISEGGKGLKRTDETKQNISNALTGKKHPPERIANMVANWGKNSDKEKVLKENADRAKRTQSKPVLCTTNGIVYYSVHEAARQLSIFPQNIRSVLKGKYKQTNGYTFRWA
jgi:group I intron endonuclease